MAQYQRTMQLPIRAANRVVDGLAGIGSQLIFMAKSLGDTAVATRHIGEV